MLESVHDVLVLTALKEELDALLHVTEGVPAPWTVADAGGLPVYRAVLEGGFGSFTVVATHQTKMTGSATAALAATLVERLKPACLAMCGVCAGHPTDTELGDVVLADRVFQHDEGKIRADGFQADLWVDSLREDWLRVAQGMVGAARDLHGYQAPDDTIWKWWLLDTLSTGRDPLKMATFQRFIPSERREERLTMLLDEELVRLDGETLVLSDKGTREIQRRRVLVGGIASDRPTALPYHIHVGPMASGNAVEASGESWDRVAAAGQRKVLAVEMEAAALGRVAHDRGLRFAVAKGVMDHAHPGKRDGYKPFAARAAAEVLCHFLRAVVKSGDGNSRQVADAPLGVTNIPPAQPRGPGTARGSRPIFGPNINISRPLTPASAQNMNDTSIRSSVIEAIIAVDNELNEEGILGTTISAIAVAEEAGVSADQVRSVFADLVREGVARGPINNDDILLNNNKFRKWRRRNG